MSWSRIKHGLETIDDILANYSRVFGTGFVEPLPRFGAFFAMYGLLYAVAIYAAHPFALVAVCMGYVGVLAIGRAWTQNEKFRSRIAKKLEDFDPDSLPDLRLLALCAALQLLVLVPLLLATSHAVFDLYNVPDNASRETWMAFGLDLLFRSFLDWSEVYDIHVSEVGLESIAGRHLVMFILLSIDLMIIQSILRIVSIKRTIEEGVAVAGKDPEMAFRLGRRATSKLSEMALDTELDNDVRISAIQAIGMIGDGRGAPSLVELLSEPDLHNTAIASLVMISSFSALFAGLSNDDPAVRRGCVTALGRLEDSMANEMLAKAISDRDVSVRKHAHQAIGRIAHHSDVPLLARGLRDESLEVKLTALRQFSNFSGEDAMLAVLSVVGDEEVEIRRLAVEILARFPDSRVVPALSKALTDNNEGVRDAAERSLKHLESLADAGAA